MGSPTSINVGTTVRNIELVSSADGHDIDCEVEGFGSMQLTSCVGERAPRREGPSPGPARTERLRPSLTVRTQSSPSSIHDSRPAPAGVLLAHDWSGV